MVWLCRVSGEGTKEDEGRGQVIDIFIRAHAFVYTITCVTLELGVGVDDMVTGTMV